MDPIDFLIGFLVAIVCLPILTYLVVKFGAAAYFRAKRRDQERNKTNEQN